jgi:hypothetical protein
MFDGRADLRRARMGIFSGTIVRGKKSEKAGKNSNGRAWGKTVNLEEIKRDWAKWPNSNIGIATGKESAVFVIETDTVDGHGVDGLASLKQLEDEHGKLPDTLMAESPSGSIHRYFKFPDDVEKIKSTNSQFAKGVDVKATGGMVLAPPSVRPGRGCYSWINNLEPAVPPQWVIQLCNKGKVQSTTVIEDRDDPLIVRWPRIRDKIDIQFPPKFQGFSHDASDYAWPPTLGMIHTALDRIDANATSRPDWIVMGYGLLDELDYDHALELFYNFSSRGDQCISYESVKYQFDSLTKSKPTGKPATISSIFKLAGMENWREIAQAEAMKARGINGDRITITPDPVEESHWRGQAEAEPAKEAKQSTKPQEKFVSLPLPPVPVDLWGKFEAPPLPLGLLPKVIEDFAVVQGELMGADPAELAVSALVVCAAAIHDSISVQVKRHTDGWKESARIWIALVGNPSTKKTPIIREATKPLLDIDDDLLRQYLSDLEVYNEMDKDHRKGKKPPAQVRLRLEDTTVEAAQEVLKSSPGGVLLLQDELSGWFGAMEKYGGARGSANDRGFWLKSWNGGSSPVNRITRGSGLIPNLSVSLLSGIQPSVIRSIAQDTHDDGLLQRLFPIVLRSATMGHDRPTPPIARDYARLVGRLHELTTASIKDASGPSVQRPTLAFDDDAQEIRRRLEAKHLELMGLETVNRKLAAHIGKYDGLFARLCVTFHCIENSSGGLPGYITKDTTQRVTDFLHKFLLPHAIAFYAGILGLADDHDRLSAVAGYILAHGLETIDSRDIARGDRTMRRLTKKDTEAVFEQLEALGWIGRAYDENTRKWYWRVNKACHRLFEKRAKMETERRAEVRAAFADFGEKVSE